MCYRELKKEKNNPEKTEASLTSENYSIIDSFCFNPESLNSMDPEKKLILKELAEKILTKLLAKERMIIVLTEVEGRSIKEVSNLMGMSAVNVKVSNYRARKNARKILNSLIKKQV
jgi:RNA polymerase sigma factor (sigma-70 family)